MPFFTEVPNWFSQSFHLYDSMKLSEYKFSRIFWLCHSSRKLNRLTNFVWKVQQICKTDLVNVMMNFISFIEMSIVCVSLTGPEMPLLFSLKQQFSDWYLNNFIERCLHLCIFRRKLKPKIAFKAHWIC